MWSGLAHRSHAETYSIPGRPCPPPTIRDRYSQLRRHRRPCAQVYRQANPCGGADHPPPCGSACRMKTHATKDTYPIRHCVSYPSDWVASCKIAAGDGCLGCSDRCTPGEYVATYSVRQKYASVHTPTVACVLHSMRVGVTRAAAHPVASLPGACARGDRLPLRGTGPLAPLRNYKKEKNINVTTQKPNGTACTSR